MITVNAARPCYDDYHNDKTKITRVAFDEIVGWEVQDNHLALPITIAGDHKKDEWVAIYNRLTNEWTSREMNGVGESGLIREFISIEQAETV